MKKVCMNLSLSALLLCVILLFASCSFVLKDEKPSVGQSAAASATALQTENATDEPTETPTEPTEQETFLPSDTEPATDAPTLAPTSAPTLAPTAAPTTPMATQQATDAPTDALTEAPTDAPTEAPTDAPTEVPTEAPTDLSTQTQEKEEETLSPDQLSLVDVNAPINLLAPNTSVQISYDRYDISALAETCRYTYSFDENKAITFAMETFDAGGQPLILCNFADSALYVQDANGELVFALFPKAYDVGLLTFAVDLSSEMPKSEPVYEDGFLLLQTAYAQEGLFFDCLYRFDPASKRLLGGERTASDENGFVYREVLTYRYASEENAFPMDFSAYTAVTSPADGKTFSFSLIESEENGEKGEARSYTFAQNAEVMLVDDRFSFYKNPLCSADITDLKAYLAEEARACTVYLAEKRKEISFDYTLTDADFLEFKASLEALEALILEGEDFDALEDLSAKVGDQFLYLESQADAGYLFYCRDQRNEEAKEAYVYSSQVHSDALILLRDFLERIYESDSPFKDAVFGSLSEELEELFGDEDHAEEIYELEHANEQLSVTFYDLIGNGTPPWDEDAVAELYLRLVANNQEIAALHGYDNYYHYAAQETYGRFYTAEEREAFRFYVASYIVPLLVQTYNRFYELSYSLNLNQYLAYADFLASPYSETSKNYLQGYISSYDGKLADHMNAFFEKNAVIYAESEGAFSGAFVAYNTLYEEPYAYFGPEYQDLLSIVHELGHYASLYTYSLEEISYDLAETHSQGNEWMFLAYLESRLADPVIAELFVTYRLYSGLLNIVYSTMVDEFEDAVYHAETPLTVEDLEGLVDALAEKYGGASFLTSISSYTPYQYVQYASFASPIYYLSYAVSEIVSISLYVEAHESYENAQTLYRALQEDVDLELSYVENIEAMGFSSPLEETLYSELCTLFGVALSAP